MAIDTGKTNIHDSCMLCGAELKQCDSYGSLDQLYRAECSTCGVYLITDEAVLDEPEPFVKKQLYLISAVARQYSERGQKLLIDSKLLEDRSEFEGKILSACPRNIQEKLDHILAYVAEKASYPTDAIFIDENNISPLFYCKNVDEAKSYMDHLENRKLARFGWPGVEKNGVTCYRLELTVEGWQKVEEQAKPNIESKQAFVAMWFNDEVKSAYADGIAKLEDDTGFSMLRIDMSQFNDKICDRILAEIRRSRFLIADVTGHRQGVYFEAGFAMGLGLPIIWTCRKDQIEECHFDTRQYNHIPWDNVNELREKLRDRILATIGEAPK